MNLFYKPLYGVVGDTIPYYHKGDITSSFRQYRDQDLQEEVHRGIMFRQVFSHSKIWRSDMARRYRQTR